ncbi:MAG: hypothetical protein A2Y00_06510 [Omnitrophica WOR_2 bacterium GWF2_43_52]|nr:MAG: hypothetical protein A2062_00395 [Omnitrophica WOR_2 bacterium GWA2_44_7]OGX14488.1 MAG: hypothetical protein A2Y01_08135 [Omnitrophica WOR_2 bacterium GWC2_44_8]OGX21256.1 MAG: hypothetical protein A2Y00_06510 [Omnitrophica WOR_2 bacterium GWF2_43_52]OGX56350.1 MAG: hypothetical protein A2460_05240 [Omnitrophica WOR_2 bacterium RIFOXYC2_FULL_43_9]
MHARYARVIARLSMPRLPRIYLEKALYYITTRGDSSQHIFKEAEDFKVFLDLVKKYKEQYQFKLYAYCLLPEHFHLLVELPDQKEVKNKMGPLSNIMHDLNSSYTKYFNAKYQRKGHLFRERYKAALIEKEQYLLKLACYIHLNPLRLKLSTSVGGYPYSSYNAYVNHEGIANSYLADEKEEIARLLEGKSYAELMDEVVKEPDCTRLRQSLKKGIVGSSAFKEQIKQALALQMKEGAIEKPGRRKKIGIIFFIVLVSGLGIFFTVKMGTEQKKETKGALSAFPHKFPAQVKELLRELENTEWQIRLVSLPGGKVQDDSIRFEEGKFYSRIFSAKHYPASEYFLLIEDDQKIIWESEQPGEGAVASWRGEIREGEMEGGLRLRYANATTQDFSFVSVSSKKRK